jgi:hypothetical protein
MTKPVTYTRAQQKLRDEFCNVYGLAQEQVSFSNRSTLDPIFDFDAQCVLVNTLTDIPAIDVDLDGFNEIRGTAKSICRIQLPGGHKRSIFGVALIGEVLHDGSKITGMKQAIDVSRARCLRTGLRAIGFDAVKAHELSKEGKRIDLMGNEARERQKRLAEIHILAGPRGLNLITKDNDRTRYEDLLAENFEGRATSKDLTPGELAEWCGMLRAWTRGMERAA